MSTRDDPGAETTRAGAETTRAGAETTRAYAASPPSPPGYLGADARVRSGPAPELVAAGYELELADAPLLHRGLGLADLAHTLSLAQDGVIPAADARALLGALLELQNAAPSIDDTRYGDLVNVRERELERRVGNAAGWLNAGRPRREAGRIAFRIALRERLLSLEAATLRLAIALTDQARRERDTPMPDFTYLQAAQPTTAGHWLLSFAHPTLRDAQRIADDFASANRSPAGAGGVNGSRLPLDRERLANLLGFDAPIEHTRDAMWQTDGLTEAVWHAATAVTNASRFAEDLEVYGSDEFGLLSIGDELCRASALMPQKRNPYALVVIRGAAGTLLGRATGVLATQRTPSGRTDNLLYAYGEVAGAIDLATRRPRPRRRHHGEPPDRPRSLRARPRPELRHGRRRGRGPVPRSTASTTARRTASSAAPSGTTISPPTGYEAPRATCSTAISTSRPSASPRPWTPSGPSPRARSPAAPPPPPWTPCSTPPKPTRRRPRAPRPAPGRPREGASGR